MYLFTTYTSSTAMRPNNTDVNVCDAIIMTTAIAKVYPVCLTNAGSMAGGYWLSDEIN